MRRRDFLAGAAASSIILPSAAEAMLGSRRAALLGGAGLPPFQAALAFGPLKQKLTNGVDGVIFVNADSTGYATLGPYQILLQQIAQSCLGTARLYLWDEWANPGSYVYAAPVDTVYGPGPIVSMYLCALPGAVSAFPWASTRKAAALDGIPTPDVAILHQGHNMSSFDTQSAAGVIGDVWTTGRGLLFATIGMTSIQWPDVPQIMTSQNPNGRDLGMNNMYQAYLGTSAAYSSLSFQNTYADFIAKGKAAIYYRPIAVDPTGVHPSDEVANFAGATLQVNRLFAAYNLAAPGAYSTASWPSLSGTNLLTNGDFSNWTGTFPVNCAAFNSQTATKDAVNVYSGSYAYSMRMDALNSTAYIRYTPSTAERNTFLNKTLSLAVLFKSTTTWASGDVPFYGIFQVKNPAQQPIGSNNIGWVQGGSIASSQGNWYMAVWPGVQYGPTGDANTSITLYPSFNRTPTGGTLWVQKMMLVQGSLPMGPF